MPVTQREPNLKSVLEPQNTTKLAPKFRPSSPFETKHDIHKNESQYSEEDLMSLAHPRYQQPIFRSSYLRPNAKYMGLQQSGKAKYNIRVEFKTVDLKNSLVMGFLQINGLTEQYPEITTCFKGEIINNPIKAFGTNIKNYSFLTENKNWGSDLRTDLDHWKKLTNNYNSTDEEFLKHLHSINNGEEDTGLIYMRWKEEFLLPDARIKQIKGASFEGFYYIVLNIGNANHTLPLGAINGLYYYKSSEKFQSLSLNGIHDDGTEQVFSFL